MSSKLRLAALLRAAACAAVFAAPARAQVVETMARLPEAAPALSAPAAVPMFGAAASLSAPAFSITGAAPSIVPSAPLAAPSAVPAAAAPALTPYAQAETHETVLGDPALTQNLLARAETIWSLAPAAAKSRPALRAALHAADFTGAREILAAVEESETRRQGSRAYGKSPLAPALDVMRKALNRPDHPAVAGLRAGLADAQALQKEGQISRAMLKANAVAHEFLDGPLARHTHRWAVQLPLAQLQAALRKHAIDVYENETEARALKIDRSSPGLRDWILKRRAAEPASVAGDFDGAPVAIQKWSDCALQALWNLPALRVLHQRFTYERFLADAERITNESIRRDGLSDISSRRLLLALGWSRTYDATPKSESELIRTIKEHGGVIGGYGFKMSRWRSLLTTGAFDGRFDHAVAIPAAVRAGGRWWFVVLDSGYRRPRLFTYGELLTLNLKVATVTKSSP